MSDKYCMLYCKEYKAWLGLEGSKSQINNWGFDFTHIDDVSFSLVSSKDDAYVFDEYGDDVEKIIDDLHYDEGLRLKRVWVANPENKTVTGEQDLEAEDKEKLDALADEIIDHCFMEHIEYSEIKKMVKNRDEFLWDKLLRHGHSELFDDNEEKLLDDFISEHWDELFNLLEEKLDEYADEYEDEEDDYDDDDYYDEDDMDESFRLRSARKNTIEEAFKLLRNPKKKINEDTRKFEDKDAEEEYFRHIQELSTDYEDPNAEECDDCDEEDIEESYLPRDIYNLCHVIPLDELDEDEVDYEAIEDLEDQVGCKVLGVLDSDVDELNYYYWCSDGYAYMGVPFATGSNTYRWYSKDINEIAELIRGSEDDLDESLKEDAKFVTAATILKKEQNSIFAQPTEEGMRKMVLSILDKNKDKMKPENYNKVVKTMRSCPKKAVPSTVWTMLNPSQKVGK